MAVFAVFMGSLVVAADAEAKRFGGGKSFGRSAPAFSKKAPPQQAAPQQPGQGAQQLGRNQAGARTSGASRWLGPLAGLAAGGLLASLFFGDGFEGFQIMDFLIIGALIFGGLMLFRALRARAAGPGARPLPAGAGPTGPAPGPVAGFETPEIGSGLGGAASGPNTHDRPAWFDEAQFLQGAKTHFIRLQAAWDKGDMKDIREYTTPELFAELTMERQSYQGEQQFTEVVSLDAELFDLVTEEDKIVATVRYSGTIREEKAGEARPFGEIWYIERALNEPQANWYVAGIQQQEKEA
jgi:predicted lipid-binding transport protein (Tim44 family)